MIKKIIISVFISILFGLILGKYIFKTYEKNIQNDFTSSKLYLLENGEYNTYEDMRLDNNWHNYLYYQDEDKYKSIVAITKYSSNINKIKSLYQENIKVTEYYIPSNLLNNKQEEYDQEIENIDNEEELKNILNNILNLYRTENNITLTSN